MSACQASTCRSNISLMCSSTSRRDAGRRRRHRQVGGQLLPGLLDTALDLADVGQVLIEPRPIGRRQRALQRRRFTEHRVEQADRLRRAAPCAARRRVAVAEQPLEDDLRVVLHRQRRVRALPGDRVAIGSSSGRRRSSGWPFDHQLERRQRRVLADLLRDDLIDGDAQLRLGAGLGECAAQDRRRPRDCDWPSRRCRTPARARDR